MGCLDKRVFPCKKSHLISDRNSPEKKLASLNCRIFWPNKFITDHKWSHLKMGSLQNMPQLVQFGTFLVKFSMLFWRGAFLLLKALNSGAIQKQTQRSLNWPDKEFCWMCFFEETQQRKPEVVKFLLLCNFGCFCSAFLNRIPRLYYPKQINTFRTLRFFFYPSSTDFN